MIASMESPRSWVNNKNAVSSLWINKFPFLSLKKKPFKCSFEWEIQNCGCQLHRTWAISGTKGSFGFGSVNREEIERSTLEMVSAGLHWSCGMARHRIGIPGNPRHLPYQTAFCCRGMLASKFDKVTQFGTKFTKWNLGQKRDKWWKGAVSFRSFFKKQISLGWCPRNLPLGSSHCGSWRPCESSTALQPILENIQADCTIRIDIAMVDLRGEVHLTNPHRFCSFSEKLWAKRREKHHPSPGLGRLEGIVWREIDVQGEHTTGVRAIGWPHDGCLESWGKKSGFSGFLLGSNKNQESGGKR